MFRLALDASEEEFTVHPPRERRPPSSCSMLGILGPSQTPSARRSRVDNPSADPGRRVTPDQAAVDARPCRNTRKPNPRDPFPTRIPRQVLVVVLHQDGGRGRHLQNRATDPLQAQTRGLQRPRVNRRQFGSAAATGPLGRPLHGDLARIAQTRLLNRRSGRHLWYAAGKHRTRPVLSPSRALSGPGSKTTEVVSLPPSVRATQSKETQGDPDRLHKRAHRAVVIPGPVTSIRTPSIATQSTGAARDPACSRRCAVALVADSSRNPTSTSVVATWISVTSSPSARPIHPCPSPQARSNRYQADRARRPTLPCPSELGRNSRERLVVKIQVHIRN